LAAACALFTEAAPILQLPQQGQQQRWSPQGFTYLVGLRSETAITAKGTCPHTARPCSAAPQTHSQQHSSSSSIVGRICAAMTNSRRIGDLQTHYTPTKTFLTSHRFAEVVLGP
jgi:hypothetical protein